MMISVRVSQAISCRIMSWIQLAELATLKSSWEREREQHLKPIKSNLLATADARQPARHLLTYGNFTHPPRRPSRSSSSRTKIDDQRGLCPDCARRARRAGAVLVIGAAAAKRSNSSYFLFFRTFLFLLLLPLPPPHYLLKTPT